MFTKKKLVPAEFLQRQTHTPHTTDQDHTYFDLDKYLKHHESAYLPTYFSIQVLIGNNYYKTGRSK